MPKKYRAGPQGIGRKRPAASGAAVGHRGEAWYRALLEQSADGICVFDADSRRILEANRRLRQWLGYNLEDIRGLTIEELLAFDPPGTVGGRIRQIIEEGSSCAQPRVYRCADGTPLELEARSSLVSCRGGSAILVNLRDVREVRRSFLDHYQSPNGLAKRQRFLERLRQTMKQAEHRGDLVAVLFLNLNRFKMVNDALGHRLGDALLAAAAGRIAGAVRENDVVCRLVADEFAVACATPAAGATAQRILNALESSFQIEEHRLSISASMGISLYPIDGDDPETLLGYAEMAMHHVKEERRNGYQFFTGNLNAAALERVRLGNALRQALERREFVLHYQPQMELASGRLVGMEALVRWEHPELGLISPGRFIHLAEESDLILPLGEWVLRQACAQAEIWRRDGLPAVRLAVNLSARQFRDPRLGEKVTRILEETGLGPDRLELELTESVLARDEAEVSRTLGRLREVGIRIAVDDFGTGYSSLNYLKRFPLDRLKIDQSFIKDLANDADAGTITEAVIGLAHTLRLKTVAEGVETTQQLEFLRALGCDEIQGFLFSRPLPVEGAAEFLLGKRA